MISSAAMRSSRETRPITLSFSQMKILAILDFSMSVAAPSKSRSPSLSRSTSRFVWPPNSMAVERYNCSSVIAISAIPAVIAGTDAIVAVLLILLLAAPAFYAAWRYAYRSPDIWSTGAPVKK